MRTRQGLGPAATTAIGCGDVSLTIAANRGVDRGGVERALHHALELGITLVDVHPGEADAEKLAADAIRSLRARDRVVTALTIPHVPPRLGAPRRDVLPELLPASYVQAQVEAALRTTRFDALPLAQLPLRSAWRTSTAYPELAGTAMRLVREGKVLAWGARLEIVDEPALAFATEPWLAALSVVFNLCDRSADTLLKESKLPVLARQPLAGGLLAGTLAPGVTLRPRDDRNAIAETDLARAAVLAAKLASELRIQPPAARGTDLARAQLERGKRPEQLEATDLAELALRFVIERNAIALPRLHQHEHVLPAVVAASALPLSSRLLDLLLACSV